MEGNFGAESFGINAGCHSFHLVSLLISAKMESFSPRILIALEIRMWEGISNEIAVTTTNRKTMLINASLISRTIKILFPPKDL